MKAASRFITISFIAVLSVLLQAAVLFAASEEISNMPPEKKLANADIPIVSSMKVADQSIREVASAVIVGDSKRVLAAIEPVYGMMDLVYAAVTSGSVKLNRNAEKKAEFRGLKEGFQANLIKLRDSAKNNKWDEMATRTHGLIDNCIICHQQFK